ncbi:hypothetical protein [Streptomyces ziwulingensis]|uniref:Secreted protein n=1 Tax=Streptomyces ziwulingensis TaxID=1045501 RepID=A0ABP9CI95_9ACTN
MRTKLSLPARNAVAVSFAALLTGAALLGALAPDAGAQPEPVAVLPEGVSVEGPLINTISLPTLL